ncbi:protease SohB [Gammaproteobacteria bacterium]|nr:protease SohB [Gammaproteobacteria bacterium]
MIEFLTDYGLFLVKTATIIAGFLIVVGMTIVFSKKSKTLEKLEITSLNDKYDAIASTLQNQILPKKEIKRLAKERKKEKKERKKHPEDTNEKRIFVINFHGDIRATNVASLREEITAVLTQANETDEVLVILENTGGIVHEHGLGASQLQRLRDSGIPITVAVDKVAASGGYMMACVAQKIIAAPFAVIGSIGVLAQLPNFHELMTRQGIRFEQETAGEYKRSVTMFGENTEKDREKLREQIEETFTLFKDFVAQHRPNLDMAKIATGEHWYGTRALELGLIDEILTSDDYLLEASKKARLYEITYSAKKSVAERLLSSMQLALGRERSDRFSSQYI